MGAGSDMRHCLFLSERQHRSIHAFTASNHVSGNPGLILPHAVNHLLVDIQDAFLAGEEKLVAMQQ